MKQDKNEKKEEQLPKFNFINKLKYSITNINKYDEMTNEHIKYTYKYILILMAILISFVALTLLYQSQKLVKEGIDILNQKIDTVSYKDGNLNIKGTVDNPIELEGDAISHLLGIENSEVIIDTNSEVTENLIQEYTDMIGTDNYGLIVLKNEVVSINIVKTGVSELDYNTLITQYFTTNDNTNDITNNVENNTESETILNNASKESLIKYLSDTYTPQYYLQSFVLYYLMYYLLFTIILVIEANILAIVGFIITKIAKLKMKFDKLAQIAIYAFTLSSILNIIYSIIRYVFGITIPGFQLIYELIAYAYMILVIFKIKKENKKSKKENIIIGKNEEKKESETDDQV